MTLDPSLADGLAQDVRGYYAAPPSERAFRRELMISAVKRVHPTDAQQIVDYAISAEVAVVPPARPAATPRIADAALRGLAGDVVRTFAPHTEAASEAILVQFLVGFGSAVGRTAHVRVGETRHHCNEFVLVVGRSARARKGDSRGAALRTVREADPSWLALSGLSTGEGLIHHVRDAMEKPNRKGEVELIDAGVSDKRLLASESEFASVLRVMAREGNTLSAVLRAAWDGDYVLGNLTKGSPARATGAHISVIAHATPADLARYLSDVETANGFANRFLIVLVERAQLLPSPGIAAPDLIEYLAARTREAIAFGQQLDHVRRTPAADALWSRIYAALSCDRPGLIGDLLARAEAHVLRLSLIYAVLDGRAAIDVEHLEAALAVWDLCAASVGQIFAGRTGNKDADKIADAIDPGAEMTRSDIRELIFSDHITAARLDAAIDLLAATPGWQLRIDRTGGRDAQVLVRSAAVEGRR